MKHLLTLLFLTACSVLSAQNEQFPGVDVTVNLIRPSVYPEDLSQPGAATVTLRLTTNLAEEYNGYLVLQLRDDNGRVFTSRNDRSTPIIRFTPTQPVIVLTGNMLQPWVEQLVDQNGPNGGNGTLTEGSVFLRAWMVDFNFTDEIVSNVARGVNFAEIHEPPTPMAPVGEQTANDISLLNFRWLANHVGSSPIKYSISIRELPDIWAQNPDVVLNTFPLIAPPVEVPGVNLTSYPWTNANSLLEEGKTYIYTIQAEDLTGRMRFRNNGISPHRIFTYTQRVNPLDMLCYSPEDLEIAGSNELSWSGEDFDDVSYTVTVREQPSNRFVSLTELEPTPTFPERTTINGGPGVRYTYRLPTTLDTTDGRAFTVQLCAVCPNTGEENCRELTYGTPRSGTGPGTETDEEVATSGEEITLDEEGGEAGAEVLCFDLREPTLTLVNAAITSTEVSWDFSGYLLDEPLKLRWQPTNGGLPDSLAVAKTGSPQILTGLLGSTSYDLTICAPCGNGSTCRSLTFQTENYVCPTEADLLAGVLIEARPPDAVYVNWSGVSDDVNPLNWWSFLNDGGAADQQRNLAGSTSGAPAPAPETLFEGLKNDTLYVVTVCHRCSNGTIVCADFETEIPGCESFDLDPLIAGVGFDTARISWTATSTGEYSISYVRSGSDSPPTVVTSDQPVKTLGDLRPSTTYEVTVCAPCGGIDICETLTLTTTAVSCSQAGDYVYDYECGTQGDVDEFETDELVTDLSPGDSIWAGDFLVEVGEITGAGPAFGGYGFAEVPYLNGAKLRLDFFDVEVNENCRMVAGEMVVKSPVRSILETIDNTVNDFIDLVNNVDQFLAQMQEALALFGDLVDELAGQIDQWDQLNDVLDAATGAVTQIPFIPQNLLNDLEVAASCMRQAAANPDAPGAEAQMEACNEAFQEALANVQAYVDALFDAPFVVDFATQPAQNVVYGRDTFRYEAITENYVVHTINGEEYRVPWISTSTVAGREGNALIARRRDGGAMSEVTFIGTDQATIPGWTPSGATASHPGLDAGGDQRVRHVFASVPGDTTGGKPPVRLAGQVSLVTYDPVEVTVHIVPVNNAAVPFGAGDAADLQTRMNAIYHPAVVDLTVIIQPSLSAPAFKDTIAKVDRHPLSNYTPAMVELRGLVKDQSYHNGRDYYLLVVKAMTPAGRDGVMPRKRRYGFLNASAFTEADGSPITSLDAKTRFARLAAHELGHGAFHLQHTFDRFEQAFESTTDNLMDYRGEEALYRYQWGNVHDPEANFTLFDEDEEGEYVFTRDVYITKVLQPITNKKSFTFLNGLGQRVLIDTSKVIELAFATSGEVYVGTTDLIPVGSLVGFAMQYESSGNPKVFIGCRDGKFYLQASTHKSVYDAMHSGTIKCTGTPNPDTPNGPTSDIYIPTPSDRSQPIVVRYVKESISDYINTIKITDYDNTAPVKYDMHFEHFFTPTGDSFDTHLSRGIFTLANYTNGIRLTGEFYDQDYKDFLNSVDYFNGLSLLDRDKPSSFYLGALALRLYENKSYVKGCGVEDTPAQVLIAMQDFVNRFGSIGPSQNHSDTENETSQFSQLIIDQVLPKLTERSGYLDELQLAQAYNMVEQIVNRTNVIDIFQSKIDAINSDESASQFIDIINRMGFLLYECELDEIKIDLETRKRLIKSIVNPGWHTKTWLYSLENTREATIIYLIKTTPEEDISEILDYLANTSAYQEIDEFDEFGTTYKDIWLWEALIYSVDDSWFDSNGRKLINAISEICEKAYTSPNGQNYFAFAEIMNQKIASTTIGDHLNPESYPLVESRTIAYNYTKLIKRVLTYSAHAYDIFRIGLPGTPPPVIQDPYINTNVTTGKANLDIRYSLSDQSILDYRPPTIPSSILGLHPFEPIILDKHSTYRTAKDINQDNLAFMPACVLLYLDEKAKAETTEDAIFTTLDVISIAAPAGALLKVSRVGRTLFLADKASSFIGLTASTIDSYQPTDPAVISLINYMNATSAVLGLTTLGGEGLLRLTGNSQVNKIKIVKESVEVSRTTTIISERTSLLNDLITKTNQLRPESIAIMQESAELQQAMVQTIRQEMDALNLSNTSMLWENGMNAINRILGVNGDFSDFTSLFTRKGWNWAEESTDDALKYLGSLSATERRKFIDAFEEWPNNAGDKFSDVFTILIRQIKNLPDLDANTVNAVTQIIRSGRIKAAIDLLLERTKSDQCILLSAKYYSYLDADMTGILEAQRANQIQNQLRRDIVDLIPDELLPISNLGGQGITPSVKQGITESVRNARNEDAINIAIENSNTPSDYKTFLVLAGRESTRQSAEITGIMHPREMQLESARITSRILQKTTQAGSPISSISEVEKDVLHLFIQKGYLNKAILGTTEFSESGQIAAIRTESYRMIDDNASGTLSQMDFTIKRNQLTRQVINQSNLNLPLGSGINPADGDEIIDLAATGRYDAAFEIAFRLADDPESQKSYLQILGRKENLDLDEIGQQLSSSEIITTKTQVLEALILQTYRSIKTGPIPSNPTELKTVIRQGRIETSLQSMQNMSIPQSNLLLDQYDQLVKRKIDGAIPYRELVVGRNQILTSAINLIPDLEATGAGISPQVKTTLITLVSDNRLQTALNQAIELSDNTDQLKLLIQLDARLDFTLQETMDRTVQAFNTTITENQIASAFLTLLNREY